jgi:hypothetical protein
MQQWQRQSILGISYQFGQFRSIVVSYNGICLDINAKGIVWQQGYIVLFLHH